MVANFVSTIFKKMKFNTGVALLRRVSKCFLKFDVNNICIDSYHSHFAKISHKHERKIFRPKFTHVQNNITTLAAIYVQN